MATVKVAVEGRFERTYSGPYRIELTQSGGLLVIDYRAGFSNGSAKIIAAFANGCWLEVNVYED